MANARGKQLDTTFLSVTTAEKRGFLHRDYIAHCFRWSHVVKELTKKGAYKDAILLDVGCGRELPLPMTLYSQRIFPKLYVGVDAGPIKQEPYDALKRGNIGDRVMAYENYIYPGGMQLPEPATHVTCFEVLEHVEPKGMHTMLRGFQNHCPTGTIFISTPCWDRVSCAANHVNEMTYNALGAMLEDMGFAIIKAFGTFASMKDYAKDLPEDQRNVFEALRGYYDSNVISTFLAPLHPSKSRNCLWVLKATQPEEYVRKFQPLPHQTTPWGSSALWTEMQQ